MKKKPIAVNILYTHTNSQKILSTTTNANKTSNRFVCFISLHSLTHTCIPNKTSFMQVKRVELTLSASSVGGENKNKTRNMKQTGQ